MALDLKKCDGACHGCVTQYIKKHSLRKGEKFAVPCRGIPLEFIPPRVLDAMGVDPEMALSMVDPVRWAAKFLDWHCLDPDGKHWQRKTEDGSLPTGLPSYNADRAAIGKSTFHRPYQAEMLRCTSKRKVCRIGRQAGKSEFLVVLMLYHIFTHENFKVVLIAPYQSQIDLIFKRLMEFINVSSTLSNSVARSVKAPQYQIELHNGSQITGFTAGTKSGNNAGASRGQSAHLLVFDEADYLSSSDIDASLAIITNFPDAQVVMSSTPTGKRDRFYEICKSKTFREFHYSSYINPNWTDELDALFKEQLTQDGYKHEVLAEFGEQEEGVYQVKYVELAQEDYEYGHMTPHHNWMYMMGVDWNDIKIGTTIAVIGMNPSNGEFRLVDKYIMPRSERTQLLACQKIAELNRVWNPHAIYVDKGFGTTQIEVLHKYGLDSLKTEGANSPNAKLRSIVKPYDFGSNIEITDLFTHQKAPKKAKPFLVENSVRRFETLSFKYPRSDSKFTKALLAYVVKRVSDSGMPVYESQDETVGDHFLDAVNLALVAFTLEKSEFVKPRYDNKIAFSAELGNILSGRGDGEGSRAEDHKPQGSRTSNFYNPGSVLKGPTNDLPAANTASTGNVKLWSWPGFGSDAPKPQVRSLGQAFGEAGKKVFGLTGRRGRMKPKRSNI